MDGRPEPRPWMAEAEDRAQRSRRAGGGDRERRPGWPERREAARKRCRDARMTAERSPPPPPWMAGKNWGGMDADRASQDDPGSTAPLVA